MQSFITLQVRSTRWKRSAESELKFGVQMIFLAKPSTLKATEGLRQRRKVAKSFISVKSGKISLKKAKWFSKVCYLPLSGLSFYTSANFIDSTEAQFGFNMSVFLINYSHGSRRKQPFASLILSSTVLAMLFLWSHP